MIGAILGDIAGSCYEFSACLADFYYGNCMESHEKDVEILKKFLEDDMLFVLNRANLI